MATSLPDMFVVVSSYLLRCPITCPADHPPTQPECDVAVVPRHPHQGHDPVVGGVDDADVVHMRDLITGAYVAIQISCSIWHNITDRYLQQTIDNGCNVFTSLQKLKRLNATCGVVTTSETIYSQ